MTDTARQPAAPGRVPSVDGTRLLARLDAFAAIGATAKGGVDRQALTPGDREARALFARLGAARGFAVTQDDAANLFLRRPGRDADAPPFLIGSHLDTQPTGGRFDGALGTLAALEVLETLEDAGVVTNRPVEAVAWTNEEGSRFAPGSLGAQAFAAGRLDAGLLDVRGSDGARLGDELDATLRALAVPRRPLGGPLAGYLELHIEQGPILEAEGVPVGVVTGIQGARWLAVVVDGEAAHAGTTPLAARRDPMRAAAGAIAALNAAVMPGDADARLTVGRIAAEPGSINAIPARVRFSVDIRHPDEDRLAALEAAVRSAVGEAAAAAACTATVERVFALPPLVFDPGLVALVEAAAAAAGLATRRLVSGAFHDALPIGRIAPAAMIFTPCRGGVSHNEKEFVEPEACVTGASALLAATLRALSGAGTDAGR